MISKTTIDNEIRDSIERLVSTSSNGVPRDWVVQDVINAHSIPDSPDREWFMVCARMTVDNRARQIFNKQQAIEESGGDPQLKLPGPEFRHLQSRYSVERNNIIQHILLINMTVDEITARARQYMAMGEKCLEHGRELLQYAGRMKKQA